MHLTSLITKSIDPTRSKHTRTGYFELFGVEEGVKQQLYKLASISLCSNTVGQVMTRLALVSISVCLSPTRLL